MLPIFLHLSESFSQRTMPRLRVLAGSSTTQLFPITANSGKPHRIVADAFDGHCVLVYVKGFTGAQGRVLHSSYFDREDSNGITWMRSCFLCPVSVDDVMLGNMFSDKPLKLPWGAALKFMKCVTVVSSLSRISDARRLLQPRPTRHSPLSSIMPHFAHGRAFPRHRSSSTTRRACSGSASPDRSPALSPSSSPGSTSPQLDAKRRNHLSIGQPSENDAALDRRRSKRLSAARSRASRRILARAESEDRERRHAEGRRARALPARGIGRRTSAILSPGGNSSLGPT
ncbi:hypothetical protein FA95DRAFT_1564037 [Auriscalpium vulgare]|uniref:Uncharacterized protein n=1 Tax=Auriscalpium vulgare TaxID=40419 RepID=A0ACB8RFN2_9AGAM|nr:hypothetical protein FA95DRAFT_1564037 [Auriscalpium vulgare]